MIKKYITLAALLSAGTALANAATEWQKTGETVKITTTFSNTNGQTSINNVGAQTTAPGYSTIITQDWVSNHALIGSGHHATRFQSIAPNFDVSKDNPWTLSFQYNLATLVSKISENARATRHLQIDSVELILGAVDINNGHFFDGARGEKNKYTLKLDLITPSGTISRGKLGEGVYIGAASPSDEGGNGQGLDPQSLEFDFSGGQAQVENLRVYGQTGFNLTVGAGQGGGVVPGSIAIQKIVLNTSIMKQVEVPDSPEAPEPSAFGLLAGLGALALVASRRRRK